MAFLTDYHIAGDKVTGWGSSKARNSKKSQNFRNLWDFSGKVLYKYLKILILLNNHLLPHRQLP